METKLIVHQRVPPCCPGVRRNLANLPRRMPAVVGILAKPREKAAGITETTAYNDNLFDRLAIRHLSQSVQATTGMRNNKEGYESFIEAAAMTSHSFSPVKQQEMVLKALAKAFPKPILLLIRALMPPCKFTREYFAWFTTIFFPWLVGPCEVKESEIDGKIEKNVVHVKKCRFLEGTKCVGMCINLCKMPSQKFIMDSFGIPVNMIPDFEDMSCQMIFGQLPPPDMDDPALSQPCYKTLCKAKQKHRVDCSS